MSIYSELCLDNDRKLSLYSRKGVLRAAIAFTKTQAALSACIASAVFYEWMIRPIMPVGPVVPEAVRAEDWLERVKLVNWGTRTEFAGRILSQKLAISEILLSAQQSVAVTHRGGARSNAGGGPLAGAWPAPVRVSETGCRSLPMGRRSRDAW